jgi:hypothetical protein
MVNLKKRYPDRVHIILGNRDTNKFRLACELYPSNLTKQGKAYWVDHASPEAEQSAPERLKWILSKTMGSPGAFEYRREELGILGQPNSDDDVVESFLASVRPGGLMAEYCRLGVVAVVREDVLFVHGGIKPYNVGYVPPTRGQLQGNTFTKLHEWVEKINEFMHNDIMNFLDNTPTYIEKCLADKSIEVSSYVQVSVYVYVYVYVS